MNGLFLTAGALALAILGGGFWWMSQTEAPSGPGQPPVVAASGGASLVVPALSPAAEAGQQAFEQHCAECHGTNAAGSDRGPPLVHRLYEPGHHADIAFVLAARQGVRAHHWRFGDMPPVPGVTDEELAGIVDYVREMQRANGIR